MLGPDMFSSWGAEVLRIASILASLVLGCMGSLFLCREVFCTYVRKRKGIESIFFYLFETFATFRFCLVYKIKLCNRHPCIRG